MHESQSISIEELRRTLGMNAQQVQVFQARGLLPCFDRAGEQRCLLADLRSFENRQNKLVAGVYAVFQRQPLRLG